MKKLYYIRHGLSEANKLGVFGGREDHPLSKEGLRQAKLAGQKAKNLKIDLVVSSTQSRALNTAKIVAKEIGYPIQKIGANSLLVERDFGDLEGKPYVPPDDPLFHSAIGMESDEDLIARAEEALEWLESLNDENILVVSHGAFGRALRKVIKADSDFHERIPNAEIICWIDVEDKANA